MKVYIFIIYIFFHASALMGQTVSELEKMAQTGNIKAMVKLGECYIDGKLVQQNYTKAIEWWERASCNSDCPGSLLYGLGRIYEKGQLTSINLPKAHSFYERAAEKGFVVAMYNLGRMYAEGRGTQKNIEKAISYYEKAASNGLPDAMNNLGLLYRNEVKDYAKSIVWFEKAINTGYSSEAMTNLGIMYHEGEGGNQDYGAAKLLFEQASSKGDNMAMMLLADMYLKGEGGIVDYKRSVELFSESTRNGNQKAKIFLPIAQAKLGEKYYAEKDYAKALPLIKTAAENAINSQASAMRLLAAYYRYGYNVVEIDKEKEKYWREEAAKYNDRKALKIINDFK